MVIMEVRATTNVATTASSYRVQLKVVVPKYNQSWAQKFGFDLDTLVLHHSENNSTLAATFISKRIPEPNRQKYQYKSPSGPGKIPNESESRVLNRPKPLSCDHLIPSARGQAQRTAQVIHFRQAAFASGTPSLRSMRRRLDICMNLDHNPLWHR